MKKHPLKVVFTANRHEFIHILELKLPLPLLIKLSHTNKDFLYFLLAFHSQLFGL